MISTKSITTSSICFSNPWRVEQAFKRLTGIHWIPDSFRKELYNAKHYIEMWKPNFNQVVHISNDNIEVDGNESFTEMLRGGITFPSNMLPEEAAARLIIYACTVNKDKVPTAGICAYFNTLVGYKHAISRPMNLLS